MVAKIRRMACCHAFGSTDLAHGSAGGRSAIKYCSGKGDMSTSFKDVGSEIWQRRAAHGGPVQRMHLGRQHRHGTLPHGFAFPARVLLAAYVENSVTHPGAERDR